MCILTYNTYFYFTKKIGSYDVLISVQKKNMQAYTLNRYPAQLSLTTWMNFVGAVQSAFFTVIVEHRRAAWAIGFNIDLWSTIYAVSRFDDLTLSG